MKLHADQTNALNTVTAYGAGYFEINRIRHQGPLLLMPEGEIQTWPVESFEALAAGDFEALLALQAEVVLFGTGPTHRMPHPRLTAPLARAGVGVEVMDSFAACRTFNILKSEGRRVLAVLLPG
ncbi:MAG: Xcc1710-like domain-containing protein [Burkholderiaceae bacterium]|nr:Xcc1710-like domain-containing protein [Burkholderiaceae bacterium]